MITDGISVTPISFLFFEADGAVSALLPSTVISKRHTRHRLLRASPAKSESASGFKYFVGLCQRFSRAPHPIHVLLSQDNRLYQLLELSTQFCLETSRNRRMHAAGFKASIPLTWHTPTPVTTFSLSLSRSFSPCLSSRSFFPSSITALSHLRLFDYETRSCRCLGMFPCDFKRHLWSVRPLKEKRATPIHPLRDSELYSVEHGVHSATKEEQMLQKVRTSLFPSNSSERDPP